MGVAVRTEWLELRVLDWGRLVERRVVVDTRNLLDADVLRRVGFEVRGVGRSRRHPAPDKRVVNGAPTTPARHTPTMALEHDWSYKCQPSPNQLRDVEEKYRMRRAPNRNRLLVLGYHNVESTWRWPTPPGSGRRSFFRQMRVLRRTANVVSLDKALQSLDVGRPLPPRAVAITFDDGYRDNLTLAVPLLNRLKIPATVFLVPGFLSGQVHAWWERLGWATSHARVRSVDFEGRRFDLSGTPARILALDSIEESLKGRDHAARYSALESLVEALDPEGSYHADELFMDWDDARGLVRAGISIGSHTMRHAILAREAEQSQREDLRQSRRLLEDQLQTPVETLAYPNGGRNDYDITTIAAARDAGYAHAVTTWGRTSSPETPAYEICRRMASPERPASRLAASVVRDFVSTRDRTAT